MLINVSRTGHRSEHPDDEQRLATKYVRRNEAAAERDKRRRYQCRMLGYQVIQRHAFIRGSICCRSVFRDRWRGENAPYRTSVGQVYDHTIYNTVCEVLPGVSVKPDDPFLAEFVRYVQFEGFMAFDTEKKKQPVVVQVIIIESFFCMQVTAHAIDVIMMATIVKCCFQF